MVSYHHIMSSSSNDYNIEQRLLQLLCLYLGKDERADCKFCFCEPQVSESAWSAIKQQQQQQANKQNIRDWVIYKQQRLISNSGGWKPKMKLLAGSVSGDVTPDS